MAMNPLKRVFDVLVCLLLAVPALLVIFIALPLVSLETKTSPLFRQKRVGREGRVFTMLKIRTMRANTPDRASHEVGADMITRTGKLLRRTKIDELPQLWNVLIGDMSLVGPRPCLPSQQQLIDERAQLGVLALRPGITGVAQLAGLDMSQPFVLARADAAYLSKWRLRRDILLLVQTATGKGGGDAAVTRQ
jgi:lipopolysaccharide/colanic/teichoic acid biosynthesis glycosyltransferase